MNSRTLRKLFSALLSAALILSMTACGEGNQAAEVTTTTVDDDIENPVDVGDIDLDIDVGTEIEPCTLTYIGNYDMTKAGDIKPSVKYFETTYNCDIEVLQVTYTELQDRIMTMIQGGDAPDLVDKQDNSYPHWMASNMYTALDDYMDTSAPQWAGTEEFIDRYSWNGKHYYYPWSYDVSPYWCVYNRGLFEDLGIEDPYELYQNGNWTWDTFKDCIYAFTDGDSEKLGFYGYFGTGFINTAGVSMVDIDENNHLVNNMKNPVVESVQLFLESLRKEKLASATVGEYSNVDLQPLVAGDAAFHVIGGWKITDYAKQMEADDSLDFFFVPIPRDPSADEYYYTLSTFGYLVPNSSQHVEAACAFINCCRLSVTDSELAATTRESIMKNKKYTDEMYDFMIQFKDTSNFKTIIDESFGFDTETAELMKKLCSDVAFDQTEEQMSWTQMRDSNFDILQSAVDTYNAYLD